MGIIRAQARFGGMVDTVSHIAGPAMAICGRVIQRCAVCGEKLVDSKNVAAPLEKCDACGGSGTIDWELINGRVTEACEKCGGRGECAPTMPTWEPGRQVQFSVGTNPQRKSLLPDTQTLAADSCIILVE